MELRNRDEIEDEMLVALLLLWNAQRREFAAGDVRPEFWQDKQDEDRQWLLYWLGAVFVASASQHGLSRSEAESGARVWAVGHAVRVLSQFQQHTQDLLDSRNPEKNIFGENRARRLVETEFSEAQSAGSEYAKLLRGEHSEGDLWFTVPDERRCDYCRPLHLQPRSRWLDIYHNQILPVHPEFAVYGEPERPPAHPNCRCFILYGGESSDDRG